MDRIFRIKFSHCICVTVVLLFYNEAKSQPPHFRNPLDIPIQLAANFGEIRADHYHTGYDIRTNEKIGYAVHAAADGYISRIKVSPYGYGNVIYITHPNGYMTVYGHLDHFNDAIGKFVKEQQYTKQSFEVELFPDASKFPVKEGDIIAYSGNSGSSEGPHLHFEIRDAHGETYPLNPEKFLPVEDHERPRFHSLFFYDPGQFGNEDTAIEVFKVVSTDSTSHLQKSNNHPAIIGLDSIEVDEPTIELGVEAEDILQKSSNGIYKLTAALDGKTFFSMKMDRLDFANGRYVNAHLDYHALMKNHNEVQRLFILPGDHDDVYDSIVNYGKIQLKDTMFHLVRITATDDAGNGSSLQFNIKYSGKNLQENLPPSSSSVFHFQQENSFRNDSMKLEVPAGALYDDLYFQYSKTDSGSGNYFSAINHVHDPFTPIHKSCELNLLPRKIPDSLKSKAIIVYRNSRGTLSGKTTSWNGNSLTAKILNFGDYFVMLDTTPPVLTPVALRQNQRVAANQISFMCADNLSGISKYNAYLDGKWLLMEYDAKNNRMICRLDDSLVPGNHVLKIVVSDQVNNESRYILHFKK